MPFSATVFNVLIASPSDVPDERCAIAASLHEWNALNSEETGKVLLPVMWESHSAPSMNARPQQIINDQVVKSCDMLIGAFWTRLGSPTGVEDSGTVEEIKWFLNQKKPVMLYYSDAPIPRTNLDTKQIEKLDAFKADISKKGLQEQYSSIEDLKSKLTRQLTIVMRGMSVGTVVDAAVMKAAKNSTDENTQSGIVTLKVSNPYSKQETNAEKHSKSQFTLEDYSEKAFVIRGDTKPHKDEIKSLGGRWMKHKDDGTWVWMFAKKRANDVAKLLDIPAEIVERAK